MSDLQPKSKAIDQRFSRKMFFCAIFFNQQKQPNIYHLCNPETCTIAF